MVNDTVNGSGEGLFSLADYARHRGISPPAVTKAIRRGQLRESVAVVNGQPKVRDLAQADAEWAANVRPRTAKEPTPFPQLKASGRWAIGRRGAAVVILRLESEAVHRTPAPGEYVDGAFATNDLEQSFRENLIRFPDDVMCTDEMTPETARALAAALLEKANE